VKRESRIVLLVSIHLAVVAACAVIGMHLMQPVTGTNPGPQPFLDRLERSAAGSAVAAEAGLLALWAAYGRQRQLWRLLGVTAGDALLALVRVPSLDHGLLRRVFSSLALITVLILVIIKTILFFVRSSDREREERAGTRRFHFSIVQLLSATAGTAVVAYLSRSEFRAINGGSHNAGSRLGNAGGLPPEATSRGSPCFGMRDKCFRCPELVWAVASRRTLRSCRDHYVGGTLTIVGGLPGSLLHPGSNSRNDALDCPQPPIQLA
jgi:hypothetical protein